MRFCSAKRRRSSGLASYSTGLRRATLQPGDGLRQRRGYVRLEKESRRGSENMALDRVVAPAVRLRARVVTLVIVLQAAFLCSRGSSRLLLLLPPLRRCATTREGLATTTAANVHTCTHEIHLPAYASLEVLRAKLLLAVAHRHDGFQIE